MSNCPCTLYTSRFHGTFGAMIGKASFWRSGSRHQNGLGSMHGRAEALPPCDIVWCGSACSVIGGAHRFDAGGAPNKSFDGLDRATQGGPCPSTVPVQCGACLRHSPGCATQLGARPSMPRPIVSAKLFQTVISRPLRYSGKGLRVAIATAATNAIWYYLANKKKIIFVLYLLLPQCSTVLAPLQVGFMAHLVA